MEHIPDACLCDGKFCPKRNEYCQECPLFGGFAGLMASVLPRSAIVAGLKTVGRLMLDHPERPPGFCGYVWDRQKRQQRSLVG